MCLPSLSCTEIIVCGSRDQELSFVCLERGKYAIELTSPIARRRLWATVHVLCINRAVVIKTRLVSIVEHCCACEKE